MKTKLEQMKITVPSGLILMVLFFFACKTEPDSTAVKKEILNIHDKLMVDGVKPERNRIKLDSILKSGQVKLPEDSSKLVDLINRLTKADENRMDWMHFFKNDYRGKTKQENLDYYKSEMIKIRAVEDRFIKVTKESDSVIKIYDSMEKTDRISH